MKYLMLLILTIGCVSPQLPDHEETTKSYSLPIELQDCKVFELDSPDRKNLYVVHCPSSVTTTVWNYRRGKKHTRTASITTVNK